MPLNLLNIWSSHSVGHRECHFKSGTHRTKIHGTTHTQKTTASIPSYPQSVGWIWLTPMVFDCCPFIVQGVPLSILQMALDPFISIKFHDRWILQYDSNHRSHEHLLIKSGQLEIPTHGDVLARLPGLMTRFQGTPFIINYHHSSYLELLVSIG